MLSGPRGPLRKLKGNFHEIPGRVLKTLILTFSPREKEPPLRAITEKRTYPSSPILSRWERRTRKRQ